MEDNVNDNVEKNVSDEAEAGVKKSARKKAPKAKAGTGAEVEAQADVKREAGTGADARVLAETKAEAGTAAEVGAQAEAKAEAGSAAEVEAQAGVKREAGTGAEVEAQAEAKAEDSLEADAAVAAGMEAQAAAERSAADLDAEQGPGTAEVGERGAAEEEAPGERVPPKQWFVVHTYSGHENKVKTNLERAISSQGMQEKFGQVLVATEDFAEMKNGKRTVTKKKTFPSYVLIEMDMSNETRHLVTNIPGVTGFVGTGREPSPLKDDEIKRVLGLDAEGKAAKPTPSVPFRIGEHVRVVDGPFSDFTGVVDEINSERGKVKVMVSIFGRATPVELDFLQVQSI